MNNKLLKKNIIITGSSGYIGKSFVNFLFNKNFNITTLGRRSIFDYKNFYFDFKKLNIDDSIFLDSTYLFHFASISHTKINKKNIASENILEPSIYLAEKAIKNKINKFIYISSIQAANYENLSTTEFYNTNSKKIYMQSLNDLLKLI